jgi:predicted Zn-dependent protease with MMP-like domain
VDPGGVVGEDDIALGLGFEIGFGRRLARQERRETGTVDGLHPAYDSAAMPKRRRGIPAAELAEIRRRREARHVPFEALVERALAGIPMPFAAALREVAIVIADEPSPRQRREEGLRSDETLYGLYDGTPKTAWGADEVPYPNTITIFRLPLEEDYPDPRELEEEVRITVLHELAHHLGIDDDRLEDLGMD